MVVVVSLGSVSTIGDTTNTSLRSTAAGVGDPSHLVGMFAASETSDSPTSDTTISVGTTSDGTYDYSR